MFEAQQTNDGSDYIAEHLKTISTISNSVTKTRTKTPVFIQIFGKQCDAGPTCHLIHI